MPSDRKLESMPLAAVTTFAQSVAHDLRHHLSTVYANAEFLSGRRMKPVDKQELLSEIRVAIDCMTDQLDSLILVTRTGQTVQTRRESLRSIIEHAIRMVRSHPEAANVNISQQDMPALEGCMDGETLQRGLQPAAEPARLRTAPPAANGWMWTFARTASTSSLWLRMAARVYLVRSAKLRFSHL